MPLNAFAWNYWISWTSTISLDRIHLILSDAPSKEKRVALKNLAADTSRTVVNIFIWRVPIGKGRPTENYVRDRQIVVMKLKGMSYTQISKKIGIKRNAVQSAYRAFTADSLWEIDISDEDLR